MTFDIRAIANFLPYCDAIFVDRQCRRLLCDSPAASRMPAHPHVFSIDQREGFLAYLDEIEKAAPAGHHELVRRVYGDHWLAPFEAIYTWRDQPDFD